MTYISKTITTASGVDATVWIFAEGPMTASASGIVMNLKIAGYRDSTALAGGLQPVDKYVVSVVYPTTTVLNSTIGAWVYARVLEDERFVGGTVVEA